MTTTIRTGSDHARPYLHMLVATNGADELRYPVILPGVDAIERVRASAENVLTDRTLTDVALRDAVHTALGEPPGPPGHQLVARRSCELVHCPRRPALGTGPTVESSRSPARSVRSVRDRLPRRSGRRGRPVSGCRPIGEHAAETGGRWRDVAPHTFTKGRTNCRPAALRLPPATCSHTSLSNSLIAVRPREAGGGWPRDHPQPAQISNDQSEHLVEGGRTHFRRPCRSDPGTEKTAAEQIDHDRPIRRQVRVRHRDQSGGQCGEDDDQAHCLVQDHRLQRQEPEHADEQGRRNSASPRPILPPSTQITAPAATANGSERVTTLSTTLSES